jgi:SAM-dependent methyltransferase
MHDSAFEKAQVFRRAYLAPYEDAPLIVLDVGSAVVAEGHRSNRQAFENPGWRYRGLDIEAAPNVDVVVADPYDWREVESASADVVACSQVLEHTEFFWVTILEIARVLRPNGLAFIIAPGSGPLHRYPVDCWRFYDDGLPALARWADLSVLESAVQWRPVYRRGNQWRDAAIVLQRPVRTPDEEAKAAAKNRLVKAAHAGIETAAGVEARLPDPSAIAPARGLGALAAHEEALAAAKSPLAYKVSLAGAHLRAIRRLLGTGARDIRAD